MLIKTILNNYGYKLDNSTYDYVNYDKNIRIWAGAFADINPQNIEYYLNILNKTRDKTVKSINNRIVSIYDNKG